MEYICPLMSTAKETVACNTKCALCLKDGPHTTCAINLCAIHIDRLEQAVSALRCDNRARRV